jgi:hypothetical protein
VVSGTAHGEHELPVALCRLTIPVVRNYPTGVKLISSGTPEYRVSSGPDKLSGVELEYLAVA